MIEQLEGRSIRTFLTVLDTGSFSGAAQRLGYVQSSVTAQIGRLEAALGRRLFDRRPRGVSLTAAGEQFAAVARQFVQLGESLQAMMESLDEPAGTVRLRAPEAFCAAYLPAQMQQFLQQYPRIRLQLQTGFQADIAEAVAAGRADLGIIPRDPANQRLTFTPLAEVELVWIASPAAAMRDTGGLAVSGETAYIGFGSRCMYHGLGIRQLEELGAAPAELMEFASMEMIRHTVRSGMGIALVPLQAVESDLRAELLARLPGLPSVRLLHGLVKARDRELPMASRLLEENLITFFTS
ncbi:LysR family transcriptional regulator [Paenibacillus lutrae]|uniref:LysR family transcriptional regulator n=1 Tax=Paenibacillus lutrae TaxID=2078573 RepID=A0A7X3FLN2_9BACL|nr:LysR family transcriptional regulator [Paenibacillus lutrae]MVP01993.1 LysR family transcriptional regulator [Paenibacillus lutrae]